MGARATSIEKQISIQQSRIDELGERMLQKDSEIRELRIGMQCNAKHIIKLEEMAERLMALIPSEEVKQEQNLSYERLSTKDEEKTGSPPGTEFVTPHVSEEREKSYDNEYDSRASCHDTGSSPEFLSEMLTQGEGEKGKDNFHATQVHCQPLTSLRVSTSAPNTSASEKIRAPAVNNKEFPLMWEPPVAGASSASSSKQVNKPKLLKMAIDTSKFGKKALPSKTTGSKDRQTSKGEVAPNIEPKLDIRHMTHEQRILYANGPKVDVFVGNEKIGALPKYVLSQCSEKAFKHFKQNPDATDILFPEGSMDPNVAKNHLQWMMEMTFQRRVYSITLTVSEISDKDDVKNMKICQAARALGLKSMYVGHFTKMFCDRIRSGKSSLQFFSTVCALATPGEDPIFDCLVHNLAITGYKAGLKAQEREHLLAAYPVLKEKIDQVQRRERRKRA
jgi:hypothetical protein